MDKTDVDVRVITEIKFEYIKGAKILCIPELYDIPEETYRYFFLESGWYDSAFCHGTYDGSVYGNAINPNGRLLTEKDFIYCCGSVISGHVHKPGCFSGFYYYCGCPYRWKFGEEEEKGFLLFSHDLDTHACYVEFQPIKSDIYKTIYLDELLSNDPADIINYITRLKEEQGIDFIKVKIRTPVPGSTQVIINNNFRYSNNTFVDFETKDEIIKKREEELETIDNRLSYLRDSHLTDFEKFVRYVNDCEGEQILTVDTLTKLLSD